MARGDGEDKKKRQENITRKVTFIQRECREARVYYWLRTEFRQGD